MAVDVKPLPQVPMAIPGERVDHAWRTFFLSLLAGLVLAIIWSPDLVDGVIGDGISNNVLGTEDAGEMNITGSILGAAFAFVTGVAGTFTACNIAVFGALAPLSAPEQTMGSRLKEMLKPIGWLFLGAIAVAGVYGIIGVYADTWIPQLSDARIGDPEEGLRYRSIQSAVVFGLVGIALIWRGMAALKLVKWPLQKLFDRRPRAEMVFMGALIGAFVIGRPFGLFRHMYEYAGSTNNPLIGFTTFALQAIGNIILVAALFVAIMLISRGRFQRWLTSKPGRLAKFTAVSLIVGGAFFVAYWDLKLPYRAGLDWAWIVVPWNQ
jgi:hypothetical protein